MRNTSRLLAASLALLLALPVRDAAAQTIADPGLFDEEPQGGRRRS